MLLETATFFNFVIEIFNIKIIKKVLYFFGLFWYNIQGALISITILLFLVGECNN